jgi:hypothetical protein
LVLNDLDFITNRQRQRLRPVVNRNIDPSPFIRSARTIDNSPDFRLPAAVFVEFNRDFRYLPADGREWDQCSPDFVPQHNRAFTGEPHRSQWIGDFLPLAPGPLLPMILFPAGRVIAKKFLGRFVSAPAVDIFADVNHHQRISGSLGDGATNARDV